MPAFPFGISYNDRMDFAFHAVDYDRRGFLEQSLPRFPKKSGVYKIFDTRGKLIVLDKTSNLYRRMERFYGERSEMLRDLDLREITQRIEFRPTDSPFETLYLLYLQRRVQFRSEEHTSELQSLRHLVCRLLLEKK